MPAEPDRPTDALEAALTDVIAVLTATKTAYALIGGLATGFRSRPRYTQDIDVLLDVPQICLPDLLERLRAQHFEFDLPALIAEFKQHHLAVLWRGDVRLDWIRREWETIFSTDDPRWRWLEQQVTGKH